MQTNTIPAVNFSIIDLLIGEI